MGIPKGNYLYYSGMRDCFWSDRNWLDRSLLIIDLLTSKSQIRIYEKIRKKEKYEVKEQKEKENKI